MSVVAVMSGGKDSFYAALKEGGADYALILLYSFPEPSPHLVNLGKAVETLASAGFKVVASKLRKGREFNDLVDTLRSLKASVIIAGDVMIEDHLKYMENVSKEVGAKLKEPLWGVDTEELLYREVESGLEFLVIGGRRELTGWKVSLANVSQFLAKVKSLGVDPIGEFGEYHSLVVNSSLHDHPLKYEVAGRVSHGDRVILKLI